MNQCEKFRKLSVNERRKIARSARICFNCMNYNHSAKECKKEPACNACNAKHHKLLHNNEMKTALVNVEPSKSDSRESSKEEEEAQSVKEESSQSDRESDKEGCFANFNVSNSILRMAKIKIVGPTKSITALALFDEGSQSTLIDAEVAKDLGLQGTIDPVTYQWTGKVTKHYPDSMKVELDASGLTDTAKIYKLRNVRTIRNLALPKQKIDILSIREFYKNIDTKPLEEIHNVQPVILIGSDNAGLIVPRKTYHP